MFDLKNIDVTELKYLSDKSYCCPNSQWISFIKSYYQKIDFF